jgi:hypothetical protein
MEALARQPRPWSATGCTTETARIASHRSLAKSPTGSTGFLATALQRLTDLLAGLGLEPMAAKTRIVHLEEEGGGGFDFLGFHHRMVRSRGGHGTKPVAFLARWPSDKAMQHARDRIRDLTARSRLRLWPELIAEDLNRFLRGRLLPVRQLARGPALAGGCQSDQLAGHRDLGVGELTGTLSAG